MARFPEVQMPEQPRGTQEQQIEQLYRTLWRITEELNNLINILNREEKKK